MPSDLGSIRSARVLFAPRISHKLYFRVKLIAQLASIQRQNWFLIAQSHGMVRPYRLRALPWKSRAVRAGFNNSATRLQRSFATSPQADEKVSNGLKRRSNPSTNTVLID